MDDTRMATAILSRPWMKTVQSGLPIFLFRAGPTG
jgi:hypothetical protein